MVGEGAGSAFAPAAPLETGVPIVPCGETSGGSSGRCRDDAIGRALMASRWPSRSSASVPMIGAGPAFAPVAPLETGVTVAACGETAGGTSGRCRDVAVVRALMASSRFIADFFGLACGSSAMSSRLCRRDRLANRCAPAHATAANARNVPKAVARLFDGGRVGAKGLDEAPFMALSGRATARRAHQRSGLLARMVPA